MRSFEQLVQELVDAGSREHYEDAALYDYEYRRRRADLAFYRELAQRLAPDGPVLDLGAGSGRVTLPLLRAGHPVVAVDQSAPMLARLAARAEALAPAVRQRLTIAQADLRSFAVRRRFPLVVAAFNVVEHLYTHADVGAFLRRVAAHLTPTGVLAFDVELPDVGWLARDPRRRWGRTRFTHPVTGEKLVYSSNHDYDPVTQIALIRIYYEAEGRPTQIVKLSQRKFFPAELEGLLAAHGFEVLERFGDFDGAPLSGEAQSQVVLCRPIARRAATRSSSGSKAHRQSEKPSPRKKNTHRRKKAPPRRG